jgi:sec-independent protein translocase protein TatA
MGGLHWYDLAVLLVLALLIFGPKRLPEMGSAVGKTIKEFRKSMNEVTEPAKPTAAIKADQPRELPAPSNPAPTATSATPAATTASTAAPEAPVE